ncbi:hypothetical protein [Aeromicrobium sp.]|uniref:hypothetical protein n=1 Tax=Aeromicrobium sp. TaxID=1871063 RepID=UPI002FC5D6BF
MRRLVLLVLASALALSACAVPHKRGDVVVEKTAARTAEIAAVFSQYRKVRNTAIELLDAKPLSIVESGPVLAIDSGSFEVSQRLAKTQKQDTASVEVTDVQTPRFGKYPLWFFAVVRDKSAGVNRVQIFERETAVDPWLLVASPETLADTPIPEIRRGGSAALTVKPDDGVGMSMSATEAAKAYAQTLADAASPEADQVADDAFIKQMRTTAENNSKLEGVTFSQSWGHDPVKHVLRTSDGGALAFVTLRRLDTYEVKPGLTVSWPEGTPQQAFLSSGISSAGKLRYYHQVLMHIPGGSGKPRAIGQYGGVVSADSQ